MGWMGCIGACAACGAPHLSHLHVEQLPVHQLTACHPAPCPFFMCACLVKKRRMQMHGLLHRPTPFLHKTNLHFWQTGLTSYLLQLHATCNATTCGECARHTARPGGDCGGEDEWARDRLHRDILHRDLAGLQTWEGSGGVSSHQAVTCMTRHGSGGESKHSWSALPSVITWLSPTP